MTMNGSLQDLNGFSEPLPIFEKPTFIDDINIKFFRPKNLFYTRIALESFMCGTAEHVFVVYK